MLKFLLLMALYLAHGAPFPDFGNGNSGVHPGKIINTTKMSAPLTTMNTDMMSNPTSRSKSSLGETPDRRSHSSNASLKVKEPSAALTTTEVKQEYTSAKPKKDIFIIVGDLIEGKTADKVRRTHRAISGYAHRSKDDIKSHGDYFNETILIKLFEGRHVTSTTTSFPKENAEGDFLYYTHTEAYTTAITTDTPERYFTEENNSPESITVNNKNNTTLSTTYITENSGSYLSGKTVEVFEVTTVSTPGHFTEENNSSGGSVLINYEKNITSPSFNSENSESDLLDNNASEVLEITASTPSRHFTEEKTSPNSIKLNKTDNTSSTTVTSENSRKYLTSEIVIDTVQEVSEDTVSASTPGRKIIGENNSLPVNNSQENIFVPELFTNDGKEINSDSKSLESSSDVIPTIHGKTDPDMDLSTKNYTTIDNDTSCVTGCDSTHFVIPRLVIYIVVGITVGIIVFMIFVVCLRKRCKKNSSANLYDIPHVAFNVNDYKVTRIPRPSISFPETNRHFLYAYSNETYNRTPDDILKERNFSNGAGKKAPTMQKGNMMTVEMKTFDRKRDIGRNRRDSKSTHDYENFPAYYWDRTRGRGIGKRQDLDTEW